MVMNCSFSKVLFRDTILKEFFLNNLNHNDYKNCLNYRNCLIENVGRCDISRFS